MSNIANTLTPRSPEDVKKLRDQIGLLSSFSDVEVEKLYETFSESRCAGWLHLDDLAVSKFTEWLYE